MALPATHLRFASDLANRYKVSDRCKYLSGTTYPDSRYVTKIDRLLTHPEDLFTEALSGDNDFKKGWAIHLLCDEVQANLFAKRFPEVLNSDVKAGSSEWIYVTALKMVQDMEDLKHYSIVQDLRCLDHIEVHNGENNEGILSFNTTVQRIYASPEEVTLESYEPLWQIFGLPTELKDQVLAQAKLFQKDDSVMEFIRGVYKEMLGQAESQ